MRPTYASTETQMTPWIHHEQWNTTPTDQDEINDRLGERSGRLRVLFQSADFTRAFVMFITLWKRSSAMNVLGFRNRSVNWSCDDVVNWLKQYLRADEKSIAQLRGEFVESIEKTKTHVRSHLKTWSDSYFCIDRTLTLLLWDHCVSYSSFDSCLCSSVPSAAIIERPRTRNSWSKWTMKSPLKCWMRYSTKRTNWCRISTRHFSRGYSEELPLPKIVTSVIFSDIVFFFEREDANKARVVSDVFRDISSAIKATARNKYYFMNLCDRFFERSLQEMSLSMHSPDLSDIVVIIPPSAIFSDDSMILSRNENYGARIHPWYIDGIMDSIIQESRERIIKNWRWPVFC